MKRKWDMENDLVDLEAALTAAQERCTRQSAQIADKIVRFRSSHEKTGQFIVDSAIQSTKSSDCNLQFFIFLFLNLLLKMRSYGDDKLFCMLF